MSATRWTLRDEGPTLFVRDSDSNVGRLAVYADGVPAAVTAGTWSLIGSNGVEVEANPIGTDGIEGIAVVSALGDQPFSSRMRLAWDVTILGSSGRTFSQDVWLVRSILRPVLTVDDLVRRHRDIRDLVDGGDSAISGYIDEAWATINADLIKRGKRPNLIMESWALRSLHLYRALALLFTDAATRFATESRYERLIETYEAKADEEWSKNLRFEYDSDEDGTADTKAAGTSVLTLTAGNLTGPRTWY